MKKMISNLKNEEGSAIVIVLIVLAALTMIGIVSSENTVVELQIVRNEAIYRQNLYKAESAAIEAAQFMLDNTPTLPRPWIKETLGDTYATPNPTTGWADPSVLSNNMNNTADPNNNVRYAAYLNGKVDSLDMTNPSSLYSYSIYGFSDSTSGQGRSMIRMGYNKRE